MYYPEQDSFEGYLNNAGLVPIYRTVIADLDTPLTLFSKVTSDQEHAFLFESMEGGEKWGRYSFVGLDPLVIFTSQADAVDIAYPDSPERDVQKKGVNPLEELKQLMASFEACEVPGLPKFYGGAVGYLGYDMIRWVEDIPDRHPVGHLPDSSFMVPGTVLVHDAIKQTLTVIINCQAREGKTASQLYSQACRRIDRIVEYLKRAVPESLRAALPPHRPHHFSSNMDEKSFCTMVEKAKEYILAGDVIQVVLSQKFHTSTALDGLTLYRALRHVNPSPYLFFVRQKGVILIGSSPEILVRLEEGEIELRPIAGTRKRGATPAEDLALEEDLLADPKERAEHLMLVDLGRNDVGRVAIGGSVTVRDLLVTERYSHVMHIVSGVDGLLAPDYDQFDVFRACFPAGTVSGAPKIRAMEIIDELECERRGVYAGAVGYFGFSGNMDFCIAIRTFVLDGEDLWIQAGAGIVADSDPVLEYEETINKAQGLRRAIELAEKGL